MLLSADRGAPLDSKVHFHAIYTLLSEHSVKWKEIGINLGFCPNEISIIENHLVDMSGGPKAYLARMLNEWFQWAPGDVRGSTWFATNNALFAALNKSNLGATAHKMRMELGWSLFE